MFPKFFAIGAINAAISIALGAFGAHGLEDLLSEHYLAIFETGVRYHMYGALGLMLISVLDKLAGGSKTVAIGGKLVLAGTLVFSVSLYVLALTGFSKLGMVTPLGGVLMIAGWGFVVTGALKLSKEGR